MWCRFAANSGLDPLVRGPQGDSHAHALGRENLFLAFAEALRDGLHHDGRRLASSSISRILQQVADIMVKHGSRDPRRVHPGQHLLNRSFQRLCQVFSDEDPAPQHEHALPNSTALWISQNMRVGPAGTATALLIVVAHFFLLRAGEHTPSTNKGRRQRTVPLRKMDVQSLRNGRPMNKEAPLAELLTATGSTMCLENQKNGVKNQTLCHDTSGNPDLCPTIALAVLLDSMRGMDESTPLGTCHAGGTTRRVTAAGVRAMIRLGAVRDGLTDEGHDLARIGTHSLRSGGAVRLKLAGADDGLIQKLGRWSGPTHKKCIQPHIGPLAGGVAARMAVLLRHWNVQVR